MTIDEFQDEIRASLTAQLDALVKVNDDHEKRMGEIVDRAEAANLDSEVVANVCMAEAARFKAMAQKLEETHYG